MIDRDILVSPLGEVLILLSALCSLTPVANADSSMRGADSFSATKVNSLVTTKADWAVIDKKNNMPILGTYNLENIFSTPDLMVVDSSGHKRSLRQFTTGKYTLLTFFYSHCSDANGCPLAMAVMHKIKSSIEQQAGMRDKVRLVSISFDPEHDIPQMMGGLEHQMHHHGDHESETDYVPWNFLTTSSIKELLPLLREFGQDVDIKLDPTSGQKTLTYLHLVKLFLIDEKGFVREIYTTMNLEPQVILNDIDTLELERKS